MVHCSFTKWFTPSFQKQPWFFPDFWRILATFPANFRTSTRPIIIVYRRIWAVLRHYAHNTSCKCAFYLWIFWQNWKFKTNTPRNRSPITSEVTWDNLIRARRYPPTVNRHTRLWHTRRLKSSGKRKTDPIT